MKLRKNLLLRKIVGENLIVPTGELVQVVPIVKISSSAAYLWQFMQDEFTTEELVNRIMERYTGVARDKAEKDVNAYIQLLEESFMIDDGKEIMAGSVSVSVDKNKLPK